MCACVVCVCGVRACTCVCVCVCACMCVFVCASVCVQTLVQDITHTVKSHAIFSHGALSSFCFFQPPQIHLATKMREIPALITLITLLYNQRQQR